MTKRNTTMKAKQARERLSAIRTAIAGIDYLCSGTLLKHLTRCGKAGCRCAHDPAARHGPYYDWGHMQAGKLVHRRLSAAQAELLRPAIANYRKVKKLLRAWEAQTERLIDAEAPNQLLPIDDIERVASWVAANAPTATVAVFWPQPEVSAASQVAVLITETVPAVALAVYAVWVMSSNAIWFSVVVSCS